MAAKRKSSAPPAPAQSSSSDDDSSSDEEKYVAKPNPSVETPKRTEGDDDESDSDADAGSGSGSESDPEPLTKTISASQKPSKSEDSSGEDEEDEEEEGEEQEKAEKPKLPAKEPKSQPDKKKQKVSAPDQSPSKKNSPAIQRIWSSEDEIALLRALSDYQVKNGKLPPRKDYNSFLSGISESISFPVTENQLYNKIRQMRFTYGQKKKKGHGANFSQPHDVAVYKFCKELFEDTSKPSTEKAPLEPGSDAGMKSSSKKKKGLKGLGSQSAANGGTVNGDAASGGVGNDGAANDGVGNGGAASGCDVAGSHFYLDGLIKDMIRTQQCVGWLSSVEDVVARIGESRALDLEAKTKTLRIDTIKLHAREEKLMAELFDILADEMADD